jgi:hypothetical protein
MRHLEVLDVRMSVRDAAAEAQEDRPRAGATPALQGSHRKPPSLCKLVLKEVRSLRRENRRAKGLGAEAFRPFRFGKAGHFTKPRAISARMSSTRQAVIRGPSLTGFG